MNRDDDAEDAGRDGSPRVCSYCGDLLGDDEDGGCLKKITKEEAEARRQAGG